MVRPCTVCLNFYSVFVIEERCFSGFTSTKKRGKKCFKLKWRKFKELEGMILLTLEVENFTTLHSTSNLPRYIKLPPLVVSHTAETTHTVLSKHWDPTSKEQSWKIPTPPKFEPASPRIQACNQTSTVIFYSQGEKNLQSNTAAGGGRLLWASELVYYAPELLRFPFLSWNRSVAITSEW